jgi:Predicted sugar nucleotidyltransferases
MKAIILAAGLGSRLGHLTSARPKCLLELRGKPLLLHQLELLAACGITEVTIVTGFAAAQIQSQVKGRADCVYYPDFASTNNLLTLHYHRRLLAGDVLVLFSDVLLTRQSLQDCITNSSDFALLVDTSRCLEGTMRVCLAGSAITDIGPHITTATGHGNFIGIAKYSAQGSKLLADELSRMVSTSDCTSAYYTAALARLAAAGHRLEAVKLNGKPWIEIDTIADYLSAQENTFYLSGFVEPCKEDGRE